MNMRSFFEAISVSCVVPAQPQAGGERTVFENLSFAVERGEIVDLVGPSGSGKSSLLTACARLNPHAHGTFALEGKGSGEFTPQQWRRDVAYLPQKPILTGKNVAEAIRLPWTLAIRGKGGKAEQLLPDERIRTTLDAMGCEDIDLARAPHDLSGGQAARVALARTLLTDPKVLLTDEVDAGAAGDSSRTITETPGEAVLAGASTYMAQARIDREQIRSQNKDTLNEIINNTNLSETERQSAVQSMVEMTELVEKESATELLLEAKGFTDVVVNLTGETADIVVPMKEVTEEQRAQIEDIVTRKTGIGVENIVITPMSSAADTAAEESAQ